MQGHQFFPYRLLISPGQNKKEGNAKLTQQGVHNALVAPSQKIAGHLGTGKRVVTVRIHPGLVDNKVRSTIRHDLEGLLNITAGHHLIARHHLPNDGPRPLKGSHSGPAYGEVEKIAQYFCELRRAVTTMLVAVENKDVPFRMQRGNKRKTVERAKPTAVRRCGVVEPLAHIGGQTVLQCHTGRQQIPTIDRQHTVAVILAPKAESALAQWTLPEKDAFDIRWIMDFHELADRDRVGFNKRGEAFTRSQTRHKRELAHRGLRRLGVIGIRKSGADGRFHFYHIPCKNGLNDPTHIARA